MIIQHNTLNMLLSDLLLFIFYSKYVNPFTLYGQPLLGLLLPWCFYTSSWGLHPCLVLLCLLSCSPFRFEVLLFINVFYFNWLTWKYYFSVVIHLGISVCNPVVIHLEEHLVEEEILWKSMKRIVLFPRVAVYITNPQGIMFYFCCFIAGLFLP